MYRRRSKTRSRIITVAAACCLIAAASTTVYYFATHQKTVPLHDSYRALNDNELPSEEQPPQNNSAAKVANDNTTSVPSLLSIPSIGVDARIVSLDVDKRNRIQAPANIYDVGWYKKSMMPDATDGYVVIDGHLNGASKNGVFRRLQELKQGSKLSVKQANGKLIYFVVRTTKKIPNTEPAEKSLLAPARLGVFELRLITCAGKYDKKSKEYTERLLVTADRTDEQADQTQ